MLHIFLLQKPKGKIKISGGHIFKIYIVTTPFYFFKKILTRVIVTVLSSFLLFVFFNCRIVFLGGEGEE